MQGLRKGQQAPVDYDCYDTQERCMESSRWILLRIVLSIEQQVYHRNFAKHAKQCLSDCLSKMPYIHTDL